MLRYDPGISFLEVNVQLSRYVPIWTAIIGKESQESDLCRAMSRYGSLFRWERSQDLLTTLNFQVVSACAQWKRAFPDDLTVHSILYPPLMRSTSPCPPPLSLSFLFSMGKNKARSSGRQYVDKNAMHKHWRPWKMRSSEVVRVVSAGW